MDVDQPRIVRTRISLAEVTEIASHRFGDMVKAAVDIGRGVMAIGGELHSDEEAMLLEDGSAQAEVWGINRYPGEPEDTWLEIDSMIKVRPAQGNRSRGVDDVAIQARIRSVVFTLVER